ncbi:hypothetical protein [Streptomyces roseoverticillatus]|uniref:Uncharacterized protein n=1 Tax=Streptomyces roseoverticillatus TaxID=66429 RepID=A0ABV3IR66_9ACTN
MDDGGSGELDDLLAVAPENLRRHPRLLYHRRAGQTAARARAYARGGDSQKYDDIAYRYLCTCPEDGLTHVETLAGLAVREQRLRRLRLPEDVARLAGQLDYLAHRGLELPEGRSACRFARGLLQVLSVPGHEVKGRFPVAAPTRALEKLAEPQDVRSQPMELVRRELSGSCWLPLDQLIRAGRFPEMREAAPTLARGVRFDCQHVFVSHRWLNEDRPDPDGRQARLVAWHLFDALCEAIRVARRRGLYTPRRMVRSLNAAIGAAGSDLAECLVVQVLREVLDEGGLAAVAVEVERLDADTSGPGVARVGDDDIGLVRLRAMLGELPGLQQLLARIRLWYDYSCIPQAPRTPEEQLLFEQTLKTLTFLQSAARTLVVLDDINDYLGRAWCSLEAATSLLFAADGRHDVLGSLTPDGRAGALWSGGTEPDTEAERLQRLVLDRQLVIWRGLLDTEVFRQQNREECLSRLGLSMTDPGDLPYIYDSLLGVAFPNGRSSGNALVTGVFPLPEVGEGRALVPSPDYEGFFTGDPDRYLRPVGTVHGAGAIDLAGFVHERRYGDRAPEVPPYWRTAGPLVRGPRCHVAIVAECESEAVLISSWVQREHEELEWLLGASVVSGSWIAVDPVPVGWLVDGRLRLRPVRAEAWAVVGKSGLVHNDVGWALCRLLYEARIPIVTVSLDEYGTNVRQVVGDMTPGEPISVLLTGWDTPPEHSAGLLQMHLYRYLLQPEAPVV